MTRISQALEIQCITLNLEETAKELLLVKGYDATMGARPMRRMIQSLIEDPISEKIISTEIIAGDIIKISADEGIIQFDIKKIEPTILNV